MFVIVRHGNTFAAGEPARRIGARTDMPLTDAGLAQARALGVHFAGLGWHFSRVLVSPLQRTMQTARAIMAEQAGSPDSEPCEFLREIDHGPDENRREDEALARVGHLALSDWDEHAVPPPGWIVDENARRAAWAALFATPQASDIGPVLLVTSNGAARFALLADPVLEAGVPLLPSLKLPTGGYGVIRRSKSGALNVEVWGMRP